MVATNVPGARFMAFAPNGDLLVSETGSGAVVKLNPNGSASQSPVTVAAGLPRPHGLAFHNNDLYIATWDGVSVLRNYPNGKLAALYSGLIENPDHNNRALAVSPDGTTIYESYASNSNMATPPPQSPTENSIVSMSSSGADVQPYAVGVRNGSGLAFDQSGKLWMVVNQRDNVSANTNTNDNNPADEFDSVQHNANYGYPNCYPNASGVRVSNPEFPSSNCSGQPNVTVPILAHSAPLGVVFYNATRFPTKYQGAAFVALHGSWNSSVPHGDKVVMIPFSGGSPSGPPQDFVTGWLSAGSYLGRPAGLAVGPDGSLYVSDDQNGFVYKVTYAP